MLVAVLVIQQEIRQTRSFTKLISSLGNATKTKAIIN